MKWKLYKICSWYNILVCLGFCFLFLYWFMRDFSLGDLWQVLAISAVLFLVALKNRMGIRLYVNMQEKQIHRDSFGLLFYFLWLFNVIVVIAYLLMVYDMLKNISLRSMVHRSISEIILMVAAYLAVPTLVYTVFLDIPLERKARKKIDFAQELFKE